MRTTQFVGLNKQAEAFVSDAEENKSFPGFTYGMFDEQIPLHQWIKDGKRYTEVVQASPWSGGPVIFTCLKDENGMEICPWLLIDFDGNEYVDCETGQYYV